MKPMNSTIRIGIADDHQLFVKSVSLLLHAIGGFEVVLEAANGHALMDALAKSNQYEFAWHLRGKEKRYS